MLKRVFSFKVLNNIIRVAKKPVVIAATKCDEANEVLVRELERLVNRKDLKQLNIPVVETSSHEGNILDFFSIQRRSTWWSIFVLFFGPGVNVDAAFCHAVSDMIMSIGVIIASIIIYYKP